MDGAKWFTTDTTRIRLRSRSREQVRMAESSSRLSSVSGEQISGSERLDNRERNVWYQTFA